MNLVIDFFLIIEYAPYLVMIASLNYSLLMGNFF